MSGGEEKPSLHVSRFYCDVDEKTRRASFLRFAATQAVQLGAKTAAQAEFLDSLHGRIIDEINNYTYKRRGEKPLPSPGRVALALKECVRQTQREYPDFDLSEVRGALAHFMRCFRDFQRAEKCKQAGEWQGSPEDVPDPNPVLKRYLLEIEPIVREVERAYGRAVNPDAWELNTQEIAPGFSEVAPADEAFDAEDEDWPDDLDEDATSTLHVRLAEDVRIHVNIVLQPKSERGGSVHGATGSTVPCEIGNPAPKALDVARVVRVEIRLPDQPNQISAFMLPYTVAHEVGIHSLQQVSGAQSLYPDRELWHFSEGFMDAAIVDLIKHYLDTPETRDVNARWIRAAEARHAERLMKDVPSLAKGKEADWVEHLSTGREAWDALTKLAQAAYDAHRINELPLDWALSVAFKVNILDLKSDARARFLEAVRTDWGNRPRDLEQRELLADPTGDTERSGQRQQILFSCLNAVRMSGDLADCRDEILSLAARQAQDHNLFGH